jgi:hypothetical protein
MTKIHPIWGAFHTYASTMLLAQTTQLLYLYLCLLKWIVVLEKPETCLFIVDYGLCPLYPHTTARNVAIQPCNVTRTFLRNLYALKHILWGRGHDRCRVISRFHCVLNAVYMIKYWRHCEYWVPRIKKNLSQRTVPDYFYQVKLSLCLTN